MSLFLRLIPVVLFSCIANQAFAGIWAYCQQDTDGDAVGYGSWLSAFGGVCPGGYTQIGSKATDASGNEVYNSYTLEFDNCPATVNADQMDSDANGVGDACQDTDGDGVLDGSDTFPLDSGGAVDTDGDGQPDSLLYAQRDQFETGGLTKLPWVTGGGNWTVQTTVKKEGAFAARSASTASTLQFSHTMTNAGSIRFWIGANSSNKVRFYIDDIEQLDHGGSVFPGMWAWSEKTVAVPAGVHVFKWAFDGCSCSYYAALDDVRIIDTVLTEDLDDDNDGVLDTSDRFPLDATETLDADNDAIGDNADPDDDNDTVPDAGDNCPLNANSTQLDTDADGQGNACDTDDDNDGVIDTQDVFPLDPSETADADSDGVGDNRDNCPQASNPDQRDTDADALGNACDTDDDNDSYLDVAETALGSDPLQAGSIPVATIISFETGIPAGWVVPPTATAGWLVDNAQGSHLSKSLRSGITNHNGKAQIQFVVNLGAPGFVFDLKTSTDTLDVFRVYVDGVGKLAKSGSNNWETYVITTTPGVHTIRFEYWKNANVLAGSDTVWIDKLMFVDALDVDADGIANSEDLDDDNDGVPDYIDAAPLDAGNAAEAVLPVDGDYKGSALREQVSP